MHYRRHEKTYTPLCDDKGARKCACSQLVLNRNIVIFFTIYEEFDYFCKSQAVQRLGKTFRLL